MIHETIILVLLAGRAERHLLGVARLAVHHRAGTHGAAVDGARNAEALLHVQLRHREVLAVDRGRLRHIAGRSGIQHAAHHEAADGLILRRQTTAVEAVDRLDAAAAVRGLRTSVVAALGRHFLLSGVLSPLTCLTWDESRNAQFCKKKIGACMG